MALQTHSIGAYVFRTMRGPIIDVPQNDMQVLERPGLDKFDLRKLGDHSKPFQILASRDVLTIPVGRALFNNYANLVGANPVALVWANYNFLTEARAVVVLRVDQVELRAAFPIANPFDAQSAFLLRSLWTLLLVEG